MRIKEIPHGLEFKDKGPPRSAGIHMSDLYGAYYRKLDKKRFKEKGDFDSTTLSRFEAGFAFEDVLEPALAERMFGKRPREMKCVHVRPNGKTVTIYFSPDYAFFIDGETVLGEFKLTWMSNRGALRDKKFKHWISQMMLYCYQLKLNKARIYVFFVNDDYKPPKPKLRCWEIEFTDTELEEEWQIMMRFAEEEGLFEEPIISNVRKSQPRTNSTTNHRHPHRGSR